ncbi:2363_t:CDS:2 [Gigaspora margarita]|uniref:2363_t:CDS:1 n=1 Tax=Gigaspora margarita TaxID=4874 RepID=A0ABN7UFZ6_GIGMA|nr:2363_t:CDS:2 [Gigaspora margarita]
METSSENLKKKKQKIDTTYMAPETLAALVSNKGVAQSLDEVGQFHIIEESTVLQNLQQQQNVPMQKMQGQVPIRKTDNETLPDMVRENNIEIIMQIDDNIVSLDIVRDLVNIPRNETRLSYSQNREGLFMLIKEKYNTAPIDSSMLAAIYKKIEYRDTAFFRSFKRKVAIKPMHQVEIETLLNKAIDKYKKQYKVSITHKTNREQIFANLRLKLASDFLLRLNFQKLEAEDITRYLIYLVNFSKINTTQSLEDIAKLFRAIEAMQIENLPNKREVLEFIELIPSSYKIPNSLPEHNIGINYTELPNLSRDHREVSKVNLIISITTMEQLTITTQREDSPRVLNGSSSTPRTYMGYFFDDTDTTYEQCQEEDTPIDDTDAQVTEPTITKDNEYEPQSALEIALAISYDQIDHIWCLPEMALDLILPELTSPINITDIKRRRSKKRYRQVYNYAKMSAENWQGFQEDLEKKIKGEKGKAKKDKSNFVLLKIYNEEELNRNWNQ